MDRYNVLGSFVSETVIKTTMFLLSTKTKKAICIFFFFMYNLYNCVNVLIENWLTGCGLYLLNVLLVA